MRSYIPFVLTAVSVLLAACNCTNAIYTTQTGFDVINDQVKARLLLSEDPLLAPKSCVRVDLETSGQGIESTLNMFAGKREDMAPYDIGDETLRLTNLWGLTPINPDEIYIRLSAFSRK